jgi:hypothetical protein
VLDNNDDAIEDLGAGSIAPRRGSLRFYVGQEVARPIPDRICAADE